MLRWGMDWEECGVREGKKDWKWGRIGKGVERVRDGDRLKMGKGLGEKGVKERKDTLEIGIHWEMSEG